MKSREEIAHLPFLDMAVLLAASKNQSYRESQLLLAEAVATVFTEQGLAAFDWTARFRSAPESFRICFGDLTTEGFAFAPVFHEWLKKIDRWTTPRTLDRLRTSLMERIDQQRKTAA